MQNLAHNMYDMMVASTPYPKEYLWLNIYEAGTVVLHTDE
jgi:hypothetical protein